jgi:branched-subunit amino acid ABC-type transport system permease component
MLLVAQQQAEQQAEHQEIATLAALVVLHLLVAVAVAELAEWVALLRLVLVAMVALVLTAWAVAVAVAPILQLLGGAQQPMAELALKTMRAHLQITQMQTQAVELPDLAEPPLQQTDQQDALAEAASSLLNTQFTRRKNGKKICCN